MISCSDRGHHLNVFNEGKWLWAIVKTSDTLFGLVKVMCDDYRTMVKREARGKHHYLNLQLLYTHCIADFFVELGNPYAMELG